MDKKYEIPYNFALDYTGKFSQLMALFPFIDSIYLPAWYEDSSNTRADIELLNEYPKSREEYEIRLRQLQALGLPLSVLIQRGATQDTVKRYYDLGIRRFILNDDKLSDWIRENLPDVMTILSVTRVLTLSDLLTWDYSMYDRIVLFFWFSRHLRELKQLPKKYKYTLMPNNGCFYNCRWHDAHWFAEGKTRDEYAANIGAAVSACRKAVGGDLHKTAYIEPENLVYFDPYVENYKLLDRYFTTDQIIYQLQQYAFRNAGADLRPEDYFNYE